MGDRKLLDESRINQRMFHLMESGFFGKKLLKEDESPYDDNDLDNMSNLILSWDKVNIDIVFTMLEAYPLVLEKFFKRSEFEELEPFLRENHLSFTKEGLYKFSDISRITIDRNMDITKIPQSILNLPKLFVMNIKKSNIKSIPIEIGNSKLEYLTLSNADIIDIPESIGNLTTLRYLDLSHNNIRYLPESISNLVNLETLDVEGNDLQELPESIGNLIKLQYLYVRHNNLQELPESIDNLVNLETLDVEGNNIQELPESIYKLPNLKWLNIKGYFERLK
jgi:Leucine-rich repeat (LRR) protein